MKSFLKKILGKDIVEIISGTKFILGVRPKINSSPQKIKFPDNRKIAVIISADFELAWAWQFVNYKSNPLELAIQKSRNCRINLPKIIKLSDEFKIPVTWATVGALFMERRECLKVIENLIEPEYFENDFWKFSRGRWFGNYFEYKDDSIWHCPDLIEMILKSDTGHEIGCHTFSHIDCSKSGQEAIEAELAACKLAADKFGLDLKSFVFPGNFSGKVDILKKYGYIIYRSELDYEISGLGTDKAGLMILPGGLELEKPGSWSVPFFNRTLKNIMLNNLPEGSVCSFWFHPSCDRINIDSVFPDFFRFLDSHRDIFWITTMTELAKWAAENS